VLSIADATTAWPWHDHGVTQGAAAGQDRDLRDRVGVEHGRGNDRVSALVVRGDLLLFGTHDAGALLRAGDDTVDRLVQRLVVDELVVAASGEQRRLVQDVGQVGTGETRRPSGHREQVDAGGQRLALAMHLQDAVATDHVGCIDRDLAVETARTQQGGVKDVGPVGGRDQDDVGLDVEAVHLDEELVERLLTLIVATAEAGATVATDGIDLVDEDDRGGVGLGLSPRPAPRWRPTASISSTNTIAGALALACSNRSRTREAPTPTNISTKSEPEME
jgi:hypothetical protein